MRFIVLGAPGLVQHFVKVENVQRVTRSGAFAVVDARAMADRLCHKLELIL